MGQFYRFGILNQFLNGGQQITSAVLMLSIKKMHSIIWVGYPIETIGGWGEVLFFIFSDT